MADDSEEIPDVPPHPLDGLIDQLAKFTTEEIRGTSRLGTLAFDTAPQQVGQILQTLRDLRLEDWNEFDDGFKTGVISQAQNLVSTLDAMRQLEASNPSAANQRQGYENILNQTAEWFKGTARPRALTARLNELLKRHGGLTEEQEEAERLRTEIRDLGEQVVQARQNLTQLEPVVEAGREAAGTSGAVALAEEYKGEATRNDDAGGRWQKIFLGTCVLAIGGSIAVVSIDHPRGEATTAAAVGRFFIDLLVIGVLLYIVRIASLQYRVHRHLAAIARSKAAALDTFARMVATGTEPSTRDALATTLAQAVFTPGDTGLIDAGSEHITLIERVMAAGSQRFANG